MKWILSILLINLIFVIVSEKIEEEIKQRNEILLNEKDMKKFEKSFT